MKDRFCTIQITKDQPNIFIEDNGEIIININNKKELEKIISNIEDKIKKLLKDCEEFDDELEKENILDILNGIHNKGLLTINKVEVFKIPDDFDEILSYLPENTDFKFNYFSNDELLEILQKYHFKENSKFYYQYNYYDTYSKEEIIDTILYIKEITSYIEKYNLSSLETIMLVYDLVREREVKKNNDSKMGQSYSRDLSRVMNTEEIVCAGYATISAAILNEIGIKTEIMFWAPQETKGSGHASIVSYINDSKYNIHQILEIDPTWRRKTSKDDYNYINNYNTFCLSLNESIEHKKNQNLSPLDYPSLLSIILRIYQSNQKYTFFLPNSIIYKNNTILLLKNIINYSKLVGLEEQIKKCNTLINRIENENISVETIFPEIEDILHQIGIINEKIHQQSLQIEVFAKALYQVRRIEHSIDSKKYPLSLDILQKIVNNRESFSRRLKYGNSPAGFIDFIFSNDSIDEMTKKQIQKLIYENNNLRDIKEDKINTDIKRMELLWVLRKMSHINTENPIIPENRRKNKRT